jgi:hypothetical protein
VMATTMRFLRSSSRNSSNGTLSSTEMGGLGGVTLPGVPRREAGAEPGRWKCESMVRSWERGAMEGEGAQPREKSSSTPPTGSYSC